MSTPISSKTEDSTRRQNGSESTISPSMSKITARGDGRGSAMRLLGLPAEVALELLGDLIARRDVPVHDDRRAFVLPVLLLELAKHLAVLLGLCDQLVDLLHAGLGGPP